MLSIAVGLKINKTVSDVGCIRSDADITTLLFCSFKPFSVHLNSNVSHPDLDEQGAL